MKNNRSLQLHLVIVRYTRMPHFKPRGYGDPESRPESPVLREIVKMSPKWIRRWVEVHFEAVGDIQGRHQGLSWRRSCVEDPQHNHREKSNSVR